MALHSARHGFSNPIHGIVLGRRRSSADDSHSSSSLEVVDVIPVCHEVPTKPIVDMALRLADAHLQLSNKEEGVGGGDKLQIVGWYTANSVASDSEELVPNVSACRIASSMAESSSNDGFVLLLLSVSHMVTLLDSKGNSSNNNTSICAVFERDGNTKTFTQKVDSSRITNASSTMGEVVSRALSAISNFSPEYGSMNGGDVAGGSSTEELVIYDYVDHVDGFKKREDLDEMDWIGNGAVNKFVSSRL